MSETATRRAKRRRRFGRVYSRKWASGRRTWAAQWYDQTQGRRVTRNFDTEREAKGFLDELERRIVAKVYETPPTLAETMQMDPVDEPPPVPSFVDYAEQVIEKRLVATLAPGTLGLYRAALRALKGFYGAEGGKTATPLTEICAASWLDYRAWRMGKRNSLDGSTKPISPRTVNADQQFASRILTEAVLDGHLAAHPLAGLKKLREPRKPRRYLTKQEIALLIQHSPKDFRPLVIAAIYTGARKSELTSLRWHDVDFERGKITLYRSKVGNSDVLDLHPALRTALLRLRNRREDVQPDDHIFLSRRGTAFTNVSKSWALAVKGTGLETRDRLTFHCLRHSFATHYLEGGGSVTDLQQQFGHAELSTTQIYAAGLSERRRAAVMALDFGTGGDADTISSRRLA